MPARRPAHPHHSHPLPAFTLWELLVVMAILSLLTALLLPVLGRAREAGRATACTGHLRQIGLALQMYVDQNRQRFPVMRDRAPDTNAVPATVVLPTPDEVLAEEVGNRAVFRCPSDDARLFETTGSSYAWNSLLNGQPAHDPELFGLRFGATRVPVFFDKERFHKARGDRRAVNYLYADGSVRNLLVLEGP